MLMCVWCYFRLTVLNYVFVCKFAHATNSYLLITDMLSNQTTSCLLLGTILQLARLHMHTNLKSDGLIQAPPPNAWKCVIYFLSLARDQNAFTLHKLFVELLYVGQIVVISKWHPCACVV